MEGLYQVVIYGYQAECVSRREAVSSFAALFIIPDDEAQRFFRQLPCVVRGYLPRHQALLYERVISRKGIMCDIRPERRQRQRPLRMYSDHCY